VQIALAVASLLSFKENFPGSSPMANQLPKWGENTHEKIFHCDPLSGISYRYSTFLKVAWILLT
jgi:hypothetical protein